MSIETINNLPKDILDLWRYFPDFDIFDLEKCFNKLKSTKLDRQDIFKIIKELYPKIRSEVKCFVVGIFKFYSLFSDEYKKEIYLIGESHKNITKCGKNPFITPPEFLEHIILSTPKLIDLFIEESFIQKGRRPVRYASKSQMRNTVIFFRKCLLPKKYCPYKNLRAHYSDVRDFFSEVLFFYETFIHTKFILNAKSRRKVLNFLKDLDVAIKQNFLEEIFTSSKILKQISFIKSKVGPLLLKEVEKTKSKLEVQISNIYNFFKQNLQTMKIEIEKLSNLYLDIVHSTNRIQDFYMLGRMFREFKGAESPKNIIVYAGSDHISYMIYFLESLKFKVKARSKSKYVVCTDISPTLPWFQKY